MVTRISNNTRIARERIERRPVNRTVKSFNDKKRVDEIETKEFEEAFNIDEMAKPHTWGVTYRDKYNKIKQHIIDAPDAYDAKMKARRELGINFSNIVDAEMIEDVSQD